MYNMYPESWQGNPETNNYVTHRADQAELRRWEAEGAEVSNPSDYANARLVATADRAVHETERERALDRTFGRISIRSMVVE